MNVILINLNIIIYVIMIVLLGHLKYILIEIYALKLFQKIIILIIMIIYIKNALIIVKNVQKKEMKLIIIAKNV